MKAHFSLISVTALTLTLALAACSPPPPIKIGFIGGLSDRNSDNGQSGLNGVTLAVEQFNRAGGVDGRMVELLPRDDAQDKATAAKSAQELVDAKVEAVVGPFTSGMAAVIVPITGKAGIFQVSPTITSMDFFGKDDNHDGPGTQAHCGGLRHAQPQLHAVVVEGVPCRGGSSGRQAGGRGAV